MTRIGAVPLALRAVMLLAGALLLFSPGRPHTVTTVIVLAGLAGAVIRPDRIGAGPTSAGFVLAWLGASGWHGDPSLTRTVIAAVALYALHSATALAAIVPLAARVQPAVLYRFAGRTLLVLAVAAPVIAADYALGHRYGSPLLELLGLAGVVALVAVPLRRVLR